MKITEILPKLKLHGRTRLIDDYLYMNWTCSGFSVTFTGRSLRVKLKAYGEKLPFPPEAPIEYPCVGVTLNENRDLIKRFMVQKEEEDVLLFEAEKEGTYTIRLLKLSENSRGKIGVSELYTDGEFQSFAGEERKLQIEFVGDSITCGYGNEAEDRDDPFLPEQENGWITYAALASDALQAEFNCISFSGISTNHSLKEGFPFPAMRDLYPYTDQLIDTKFSKEPEPWNFEKNRKDIVVLNLGTNDVNPVRFYTDLEQADKEEEHFGKAYQEFLKDIRRLNGPSTMIVCTLGPLDYYLFDNIRSAVEEYKSETGDEKIYCFKLIGVNLMTEGYGAVGHPSAKTHERLGRELAERLKRIL